MRPASRATLAVLQPTAALGGRAVVRVLLRRRLGTRARTDPPSCRSSWPTSATTPPPVRSPSTASDDRTAARPIEVPAHGQVTVEARSILAGEWVAAQVEVLRRRHERRSPDHRRRRDRRRCRARPSSSSQWTLPSGSTVRGSDELLALFNPFADDATVDMRFVTDTGVRTPRSLQGFQVPGRSLRVVARHLGGRPPADRHVDRPDARRSGRRRPHPDRRRHRRSGPEHRRDEDGPVTAPPKGVSVTSGMPLPARTWFFADAAKPRGARYRVVVYNAGRDEAQVDVHVDLDDPRRNGTLDPFELTIEPRDVQVLDLTAQGTIPDVGFSVTARSVERPARLRRADLRRRLTRRGQGHRRHARCADGRHLVAVRRRGERGLDDANGSASSTPGATTATPHRRAAPPERRAARSTG